MSDMLYSYRLSERSVPFRRVLLLVFITFVVFLLCSCQQSGKSFLVCGDYLVHLVDYDRSRDTVPHIVWTWDAREAPDLPDGVRPKFRSIDDCKPAKGGEELLVSSSSGAVAILDARTRNVLFHAAVPNAHSVELLPGNLLAAAASTAPDGNKIMVFDLNGSQKEKAIFTDSLYSAHGLVWHQERKSLFALGYDVLREYEVQPKGDLLLKDKWTIPGIGGHDLQASRDGKVLYVTEHNGAWAFDIDSQSFKQIEAFPNAHNIKSVGQNKEGQYILTVPEESWWTFHVTFANPDRKLAFPGMKVYKARWFSSR